MRRLAMLAVILGGALAVSCTHTERKLTHSTWVSLKGQPFLYVAYWEGECKSWPFSGCDIGETKIKSCSVRKDNGLECVEEKEANATLKKSW